MGDASSSEEVGGGDGSRSEVIVSGGMSDSGWDGSRDTLDAYRPPVQQSDAETVDSPAVNPGTGGTGGVEGTDGGGGTEATGGIGGTPETGGIVTTGGALSTTASAGRGGAGGVDDGGIGGTTARDAAADTVDAFVPRLLGAACVTGADCASSFCADGVCCDARCNGQCETCNAAGRCTLAPAGPAPATRTACPGTGTCASKCDGKVRTCVYPTGTTCSEPTCTAGSATAAGTCSSSGTCVKPDPTVCSTGVCGSDGQCADRCTATSCPSGSYCNSAGACAPKKAPGAACANGNECGATAPVCGIDGVCCESACEGACQACNSQGMCVAVAAGSPRPGHPTCNAFDATCAGSCNGTSTSCSYPNNSVQCTPASCTVNQLSLNEATVCDGNGSCTVPSTTNCASGYYCKDASCSNPQGDSGAICNGNIECLGGLSCVANSPSGKRCCSSGLIACGGTCTNPNVEPNCGVCGTSCGANKNCQNKVCTCTMGTITCGGVSTCAGSNFEKDVDIDGWSIFPSSTNFACCPASSSAQAHGGSKALQFSVNPAGPPAAVHFQWSFCPSGTTTLTSLSMWLYSTRTVSLSSSNVTVLDASGNEGASSQIMLGSITTTWTQATVTFSPAQPASGVVIRLNGGAPMSGDTFQVYVDDVVVQ